MRNTRRTGLVVLLACLVMAWGAGPAGWGTAVQAQEEPAAEEPAMEPADAGSGGATPAAEDTVIAEKSFLRWLHEASGPFGYCIGAESFILVALGVMSFMQFRKENFVPDAFVAEFEQKLQAKDYKGAYELAAKDESFLAKMLTGGLARLSNGYEDAVTGMQEVGEDENMNLDHRLSYISLIGTTAPMLGLLGTVQGMVAAFSVIARSTTSPKPNELAEGITMALVTTLEGLIVAIPAVVFFAVLKNFQGRLVTDSSVMAEKLMGRFAGMAKRPAAAPSA